MDEIWTIYQDRLVETQAKYGVLIYAFVLMANHFHSMFSTPNENISEAMRYLLTEISREIGRRTGRINHIFGGRYRWSVLWSSIDVAYVYKYVLRNPIRAGVCRRVEEYPLSSFFRLVRRERGTGITDGIGDAWVQVPRECAARARWLNSAPQSDAERLISLGLRHFKFRLPQQKDLAFLLEELRREYQVEPVDKSEK